MANFGRKDGIFHVRFRYHTREYKTSLKVRDRTEAGAAKRIVELTVHRLLTGQAVVPTRRFPWHQIPRYGRRPMQSLCPAQLDGFSCLIMTQQGPMFALPYLAFH
jgi:hypothetical protein